MRPTRSTSGSSGPRPARGPEDQPGNTFRYLYWRLSEKQFQNLCAALLRKKFDPVQCYPVGMADEGIDAISDGSIVYQMKWTSKIMQDPVAWLEGTMEKEKEKVERLVAEGRATRYILLTSVGGTTTGQQTGTVQKLQKKLDAWSDQLGIPVECWWQGEIDAEVDDAGDAIKWSYPDMLAGVDAIRYLIFGAEGESTAARMRDTMRRVLAAQSRTDAHVRFSQIEIEGVSINDLFVDVHATLVAPPRNAEREFRRNPLTLADKPRGAVDTLLSTAVPLTFLMGVPGQGKSTLSQYLCEVHRSVILASDDDTHSAPTGAVVREPKLPLRVTLKEYAAWVDGYDPFADERARISRRRSKKDRSAERYLAELCVYLSGGRSVRVEDLQALLEFYPTLIVFDGLDEVADPELRRIVVEEIEALTARMARTRTRVRSFQVLVTSRPNATGLAEPSPDQFQRLRLDPMNTALQNDFVGKWCDARGLDGAPRENLRRIFRERTALEHVAKLADNPMQLSILLHLISKKGDAVPVARTPLYTDYMGTLMDREVADGHISPAAVPQVQEVTSFLGWHMQSGVELDPAAGAMRREDIETTLIVYLRSVRAEATDAAELFRVASDRYWALTAETDEVFEFAVQPVREYFAARFLAEWGGLNMREPLSKQKVLREMLGRPYWMNVARFYAGFASPNELAGLQYGVEEALESKHAVIENRVGAWALLSDAAFVGNLRAQRDVVSMVIDDLTVMLAREPEYVNDFRRLAHQAGGSQLAAALQQALASEPTHRLALARAEMLRLKSSLPSSRLQEWGLEMLAAAPAGKERTAWMRIGQTVGITRVPPSVTRQWVFEDLDAHVASLGVGVSAEHNGALAVQQLRAVLDGHASDARARLESEAGMLLVALRPQWFHQALPTPHGLVASMNMHLTALVHDEPIRNRAWNKLLLAHPEYAGLRAAARKGQHSQRGTTELWQASARELARLHGPSWLAAEIALTAAAASELRSSGSKDREGELLGPRTDYGSLVIEIRKRPSARWWRDLFDAYADDLSRRTWALALVSSASPEAIAENAQQLDATLAGLPPHEYSAFTASSSRIGQNGSARTLPLECSAATLSAKTRLVLSHFQFNRLAPGIISVFSDEDLLSLACDEPAVWTVAEALADRLLQEPTLALLPALARLDIDSVSSVSMGTASLNPELAQAILDAPGTYPTEWVLKAEASSSRDNSLALETLALEGRWTPRVPRL